MTLSELISTLQTSGLLGRVTAFKISADGCEVQLTGPAPSDRPTTDDIEAREKAIAQLNEDIMYGSAAS